jgi:hypothetical protein
MVLPEMQVFDSETSNRQERVDPTDPNSFMREGSIFID